MNYLFIPFSSSEENQELLTMGTTWVNNSLKDKREKEPPRLLFYNMKIVKPLSIVNSNDNFYILAHGDDSLPGFLGNKSTLAKFIDPNELAARLKTAGLPLTHTKIKIYACSCTNATQEFATDFKRAMRDSLGYGYIDVYYYKASITVPNLFADGMYHKDGVLFGSDGTLSLTPRFRASDVKHRVP